MTTETKSEKFRRLSGARLPKVLHSIGLLENLAGSAYDATPAEAEDLVSELYNAVGNVAAAFKVDTAPPWFMAPAPDVPATQDNGGFWSGRPVEDTGGGPGLGVDGYDRAEIRRALSLMDKNAPGVPELRKVVLGWAPVSR